MRLAQVPSERRGAEPDARAVPHQVIADFMALGCQLAHQPLPALHPLVQASRARMPLSVVRRTVGARPAREERAEPPGATGRRHHPRP